MTDEELVKRLRDLGDRAAFEPHMHHEAADRIEDLTEQLEAARADAKEAEAYADELEGDLTELCRQLLAAEDKLAKAVEALKEALYFLKPTESDMEKKAGIYRIVTTLAEIEGDKG